ncbi:MAG TPA: molybdopterin-guanine dinucleotide biosynthesis protein MobB, partial [Myxococcota bacterium]|nr:molybdopterin-guanine dinucleotide biosynthesis protein MobB [Myxococcota bacterium]
MADAEVEKVGVLIVSGFLGSGKTTLVRRILEDAQARGLRVGIVSNEFGELGIDQALLGGGEQRFVELAGGCVCCQLSDELVETLQAMREKVNPERIV